ncbi:MAG: hypothetical protein IJY53_01840, partial [Akkermansia sp.]|nr:hypothetical protein [Akkermansia sp.]
ASSSTLTRRLLGLGDIFIHVQGLTPLPIGCRPYGLYYSSRSREDSYHVRPQGRTIMPRYHVKLSCEQRELSCKTHCAAQ